MVKVKVDLTGQQFGMLTVIKQAEDYISPKGVHFPQWECECSCDEHNHVIVLQNNLKSKNGTKSCGCLSHRTLLTVNGETHNVTEWSRITGLNAKTISGRMQSGWDKEHIFDDVGTWKPAARFNEHYFDVIDDEHKAYWLGFIWCDGYMAIRHRNNRVSYEFKLSLSDIDASHLIKFNDDLNGSYKVKYYNMGNSSFTSEHQEARLLITNQHFGKNLVEKYGLIPRRSDCTKILNNISEHLMKHFIRGVIEADGSFCKYRITEKGYGVDKYRVSIGTNEDIVRCIEKHLMDNKVINIAERKLYQRHEGQDGEYKSLEISGKTQTLNILHYIYDGASVYLDRKYEKYLNIIGKQEVLTDDIQVI